MSKTKICKHCRTEIDSKAKVCPNCKRKQGGIVKYIVIGVIALIVIGAIAGGKDDKDEPKKVANASANGEKSEVTEEKKDFYSVGEVVSLKDIETTLVNVTEYTSTDNEFVKPEDGKIFVLCEFEIANNSKDDINVSSAMSFEAYCDGYSINQSITGLMADKSKSQLDGVVAAGKKMNGVIAYEIPVEYKEVEIKFQPSFWGKKITYKYTK